ncbi:MAG: pyruvate dehydrogenase complex dihydrolipoamide acetyltransferase [Alphaproteobacteria bacterium]
MPINITMPALSPTMTDGTLAKWLKKEGDAVKAGDVIAEIETDKATMEVEAVDEGILGKILVPEGTEHVAVNAVIAILLEEGEDKSALVASPSKIQKKEESKPSVVLPPSPSRAARGSHPLPTGEGDRAQARSGEGQRIFASPLAKRLARERGIDLFSVRGSGPRGRIIRDDILNAGSGPGAAPARPTGPDAKKLADQLGMKYKEIPNNAIRKIVAARLQESKQLVPHFYLTIDCVIDNLLASRKDLNEKGEGAYKLSVNDFVIKAAAMALKSYPAANVAWTDAAILQYESADISVAVATPNGLMTPIVKAAETKGLKQISEEVKDLARRARDSKLKPEEFQGGTFTISNLGMYGIKDFGAIINPPQACILAVGGGVEQPVVENGEIVIRTIMSCTLSVDHRAVDGAVGAEYLQTFKKYLENPVSILL